ncbi:unnamed protein product [Zymoseptoria tritici ST99CH_3D1]|nr:unnamed protein product [Zymoseptoria tritici ST99CH_3D1]
MILPQFARETQRSRRVLRWSILLFVSFAAVASIFALRKNDQERWAGLTTDQHYQQPQKHQHIIPSRRNSQVIDPADGKTWPYRVFKSDSARPPRVEISGTGPELSDDFLFVTGQFILENGELDRAPYMFSADGELVFAATRVDGTSTGNFLVQEYLGRPHLTTWRGMLTKGAQVGHGYGALVLLDENYEETVVDVRDESINTNQDEAVSPGIVDIHEQRLTWRDSVLVSVYNATTTNATHIGGQEHQSILDGLVYEIDIATQEVLWSWSALEHISLEDSACPIGLSVHGEDASTVPWDAFHLNSIDPVGADHFLVSIRSTWSIYLVNRHTKRIVWTLHGQRGGDFGALPANGTFRWQHDARLMKYDEDRMVISLFDNHRNDTPPAATLSRGLVLELALPPDSSVPPKVLRSTHVANDSAAWQGNYQAQLSNGNELLSYGDKAYVVEFGPGSNGERDETWRARYGFDGVVPSYRGFKLPWKGMPRRWDPSLVVEADKYEDDKAKVTAYVSWNGATDVAHWQLYTSDQSGSRKEKAGIVMKYGFETMFELDVERRACLQIAAVSSNGTERLSNLVCV